MVGVVLSSGVMVALVGGLLTYLVSWLKGKGQLTRDRGEIAKIIYQTSTKETAKECVTRYNEIYEGLTFKK